MITINCAGYLGKDAVVGNLQNGTPVANFSVGCNAGKGDDGQPKTVWIECAMFGERGEKLAPYLKKGKAVAVTGRGDLREYTTKDGRFGASIRCAVSEVALLSKKDEDNGQSDSGGSSGGYGGGAAGGGYGGGSSGGGQPPMNGPNNDLDDEIPF